MRGHCWGEREERRAKRRTEGYNLTGSYEYIISSCQSRLPFLHAWQWTLAFDFWAIGFKSVVACLWQKFFLFFFACMLVYNMPGFVLTQRQWWEPARLGNAYQFAQRCHQEVVPVCCFSPRLCCHPLSVLPHLLTPPPPLHRLLAPSSTLGLGTRPPYPLSPQPLPGVKRSQPSFFRPPPLADVFEWCSADGECCAMTDRYDKQMVLLVVFNHRNSVGHEVRALSCQRNTKWRQIYPRHHRFWSRKCVGASEGKGAKSRSLSCLVAKERKKERKENIVIWFWWVLPDVHSNGKELSF